MKKALFVLLVSAALVGTAGAADIKGLTAKANKGDAAAAYQLGMIYLNGDGLPAPQPKKAAEWLEKAAKKGHSDAQYEYGTLIFFGEEGVPADKIKACSWLYTTATDGGDYLCAQLNEEEKVKAKALALEEQKKIRK